MHFLFRGGPRARIHTLILAFASVVLLQGCEVEGACVKKEDGVSYCTMKEECTGTHHVGSSCADVGYPHHCDINDIYEATSGAVFAWEDQYLNNPACDPRKEAGGGGGDCESSCPSEGFDPQLDTFCRTACCYHVSGSPEAAAATCEAGADLGTSQCSYCS